MPLALKIQKGEFVIFVCLASRKFTIYHSIRHMTMYILTAILDLAAFLNVSWLFFVLLPGTNRFSI